MKKTEYNSIDALHGLISSESSFRNLAEFISDFGLEVMSIQAV